MDIERLKERIILIQNELNSKVYSLNSGGCIHFAYYLCSALETLGIPHKPYFCDWYDLGTTYSTFSSCDHVMVYIPGIGYVDGHKTREDLSEYRRKRNIKLNLHKLRTNYSWNPYYKKGVYNKVVSKTIKKYLSDY